MLPGNLKSVVPSAPLEAMQFLNSRWDSVLTTAFRHVRQGTGLGPPTEDLVPPARWALPPLHS